MASYAELIRKDVCRHKSCHDASSWPSTVSQFVRSLQNELKLPRWLKSGPVPYTNERVLDLLDHFRVSDDAARGDLWDNTDPVIDHDLQPRLHVVFHGALADCARIRAVVDAEQQTQTPFPKVSFLAVLVRNAILNAHSELSSLEDISVVLPRHFSGEANPILNYMTKSFYAPLIISICEEISIEGSGSDLGHQPSDDDEDSSYESELFNHSPPTMSEFLDACGRTETLEEVEEEQEDVVLPPRFEAYFLACPSSATPPSICHIPVLCMADEEQLPVLMSSLLYQRRVWHIGDPLIGVEFSKYDTTIRLCVGWLEGEVFPGHVLPRVHLGEMGTPVALDLSSPSVALVVSRLLCSLESHISSVRDTIRHSVGAVISERRSHSSVSWRIDTDIEAEDPASILENNKKRDMIISWAESQQYEETMPPRKQADKISLSGSATSMSSPQQSTSVQPSHMSSPSPVPSQGKGSSIPEPRKPHEYTDSVPTLYSRLSCSAFATTTEKDDHRVFRWMFDRRVIPQSLPSDLEFCEEYSAMTGFIWPATWHVRDDLPSVDAALEPSVQELLEGVAAIKARPNAVKCIPVEEFPFDLRLLSHSFSAIFQASRRSREKKELREDVYEASWRHDHDRLLFDFFVRLVQPGNGDGVHILGDGQSVAHLEDPCSRPTLETALRLPKSDNLERSSRKQLQKSIQMLILHEPENLDGWLESRGGAPDISINESRSARYVLYQWLAWADETDAVTEAQMISQLGRIPSTGRCDALGRLLVELPNVSNNIGHFPLVVRAAGKGSAGGRRNEDKAPMSGSRARTCYKNQGEPSTKTSSNALTVPDASPGGATRTNATRYTIPSSSVPSSTQSFDKEQTSFVESVDALASKGLRLRPDTTLLELPILVIAYKKASDSMMKRTNQVRMYLTASAKFLQAVGITNIPVYGVQTDGPIIVIPAAVVRDDNFVYLFERLVERLDISTPLGAWHYATILCRLAQHHAKILEKRFDEVRDSLITSLLREGNQADGWTVDRQMVRLKAENRAKSPPRKKKPETM